MPNKFKGLVKCWVVAYKFDKSIEIEPISYFIIFIWISTNSIIFSRCWSTIADLFACQKLSWLLKSNEMKYINSKRYLSFKKYNTPNQMKKKLIKKFYWFTKSNASSLSSSFSRSANFSLHLLNQSKKPHHLNDDNQRRIIPKWWGV